ncbi:hypothetical protein Y032_0040g188 [Ancylostoma ceylanicum]|uniref:guanylate cyclase n=1 Tax=Ancylostoma ceylanicum TaxID=53326 RepID=A0A016UIJ5_9BILA|nr:hypothetical protein Y032_0040g188 [Ancylostoma ceylanicum]
MVLLGDRFEVRAYYSDNVLITKHKQVELKPAEYDSCVKMLKMDHENINKFIGLSLDGPDIIKVWKFCERGTLQNVISSNSMSIDAFFAICLIKDVAEGMNYIHQSFVSYIGSLSSATCLVSQGWQVKISDYGLDLFTNISQQMDFLWTAPELLRHSIKKPSKHSDIYSFAIICSEIITRRPAWNLEERKEKVDGIHLNGMKFHRILTKFPLLQCNIQNNM